MVIIYGTRSYGRVDQHEGEYAATSFFHVYYLPLVPTGSSWVTASDADGIRGYKIPLHGRSVLAGYLRIWGLVLAAIGLYKGQGGSYGYLALGIAALAASAWAWSWRSLRGDRVRRRSDLNYVAYGARCEPARLPPAVRAALKQDLDRRWSAREPSRSPNEVAQHGSTDPHETAIAYGLLRLGGVERGRAGHAEHADADRILDAEHVATAAVEDGPYRAATGVPEVAAASSISDLVAARVAAAHRAVTPEQTAHRQKMARRTRRRWRLGLVGVAVLALGGVTTLARGLEPRTRVALSRLQSVQPPLGKFVHVTCDTDLEEYLAETALHGGDVTGRVYMCPLGTHYLPVYFDDAAVHTGTVIEGKLQLLPQHAPWVSQALRSDTDVANRTLEVYVNAGESRRGVIALGLVLLAVATCLVLSFVGWRKRNAALLAP